MFCYTCNFCFSGYVYIQSIVSDASCCILMDIYRRKPMKNDTQEGRRHIWRGFTFTDEEEEYMFLNSLFHTSAYFSDEEYARFKVLYKKYGQQKIR